jgi:predicted dehydrogenase
VCTPSALHVPTAISAVRAGCAVFVEKPLSHDLCGVDELVRAARAHDAVVAVGFQLRFHPGVVRLRELVDTSAVGTVLAVHVEQGEYLPGFHPYEDYRQSYAARRDLGGGVVLTQIHELDYIHWIFGLPSAVFAVGGTWGDLGIDVEDTSSALLRHGHGGRTVPVHVHLDYLQRPARRSCRVVGDRGTIELDLRRPSLTVTDADGTVVEHDAFAGYQRVQLFIDELRAFLASARRERPPEVGLEHAVDTMRLALALRRSAETGDLVAL